MHPLGLPFILGEPTPLCGVVWSWLWRPGSQQQLVQAYTPEGHVGVVSLLDAMHVAGVKPETIDGLAAHLLDAGTTSVPFADLWGLLHDRGLGWSQVHEVKVGCRPLGTTEPPVGRRPALPDASGVGEASPLPPPNPSPYCRVCMPSPSPASCFSLGCACSGMPWSHPSAEVGTP
jgi:hypothetical protein